MSEDLVVGADVGGTGVKYIVQDAAGHVQEQGAIATDPHDTNGTLERLARAIADHGRGGVQPAGVGLACAGIVSPETGSLGRSPNLPGWQDRDLIRDIQAVFGPVPAVVANDVNAALVGEALYGAGRGCRDLVMVALGTGVGGGVMVGGALVVGRSNGAAEIGHMILELDGAPCRCGNTGCLEAYCGSVGIVRRALELAEDPAATPAWGSLVADRGAALTTRDCFQLAEAGDATAMLLFAEVGRRLGQAVASLVNVLAPERVIVGGGVALAGDLVLEPCRRMVERHVLGDVSRRTPVLPAELGTYAAARGAAALAGDGALR